MTMLKIKLNKDYLIPFAPIVKQDTTKGSGGLQTQQRPVIHKVFISHDEYYSRERERTKPTFQIQFRAGY